MKTHVRIIQGLSAIIGLILFSAVLVAQDTGREPVHSLSFSPGFIQIKDEYNYGLVNSGLNLAGRYAMTLTTGRNTLAYKAELGFGMNYNNGLGMAWSLKPFDLLYGFGLYNDPACKVTLGPYVSGYYLWQLYPELQSGHMFWFSSYELGPRVLVSAPVKSRILNISLSGSVAGLNSRPDRTSEEYYYSLTFSDFAGNPHSNMKFGSVNVFNHFHLMVEWVIPDKKFTVGYAYEYIGYGEFPAFRYSLHSIELNWVIGNHKTK